MTSARRARIGNSLAEVFRTPSTPSGVEAAGESSVFYAVVLPKSCLLSEQEKPPFIFKDLAATIQFCKRFKDVARWKKFSNQQAAIDFCGNSTIVPPPANGNLVSKEERKAVDERSHFRSPKPQDYVQFRKFIVDDNKELLLNLVWSNPRYLIGGGDNPTILHEGCRYNAFHIAARCNKHEILKALISVLRNESLFRLLYPDDDEATMKQRMKYIINMYLNIPDKTKRGDRPLHFASALGYYECVQVLISQEECVKDARNGEGFTALDLAASRMSQTWPQGFIRDCASAITELLDENQVIIPVIRDGSCLDPLNIGIPMSSMTTDFDFRTPPRAFADQGEGEKTQFHVVAFAGPLAKDRATRIIGEIQKKRISTANVRRLDAEKGLVSVVRSVAIDQGLRWTEFWPFLNQWADFSTNFGLLRLEDYFTDLVRRGRAELGIENQVANNQIITKEEADSTIGTIKALKNFVDGSVDQLPELDFKNANHDEVADAVASYVFGFMSEHERKYIQAELNKLDCAAVDRMQSCVLGMLMKKLEKLDPTKCECNKRSPKINAVNGDVNGEKVRKPKLSRSETLHIGFIHGPVPSRTDYQVWMALGSKRRTIDAHCFPCIHRWLKNMATFSSDQMIHWGTPKKSQTPNSMPSSPNAAVPTTPLTLSTKVSHKVTRARRTKIFSTDDQW